MAPNLAHLAIIPLIPILALFLLPEQWRESYAWWNASTLNSPLTPCGRVPTWRNIGYWEVCRILHGDRHDDWCMKQDN